MQVYFSNPDISNSTRSLGLFSAGSTLLTLKMSRVMRKPTFCICENKDADQLRGNREADQRLCFSYIYSTLPLLSKSEISSIKHSSVAVQPGLCRTRSETKMLFFSRCGSNVLVCCLPTDPIFTLQKSVLPFLRKLLTCINFMEYFVLNKCIFLEQVCKRSYLTTQP